MKEEMTIGLNEKRFLTDGSTIESRVDNPMKLANFASDTAVHESLHAGTAPEKVKRVSIIPGPGYLGITEFSQFDAPAAAAPHHRGMSGTSWDEYLILANGHSPEAAGAAANARLVGKDEHINILSRRLEAEKTLTGRQVVETMNRVENGEEVVIKIKRKNGDTEILNKKGVKENIIVEFLTEELPQAA